MMTTTSELGGEVTLELDHSVDGILKWLTDTPADPPMNMIWFRTEEAYQRVLADARKRGLYTLEMGGLTMRGASVPMWGELWT